MEVDMGKRIIQLVEKIALKFNGYTNVIEVQQLNDVIAGTV